MPPEFMRDIRHTLLRILGIAIRIFSYGAITLYSGPFQVTSNVSAPGVDGSKTPHLPYVSIRDSVCPIPLSIAFTNGISVDFFSCGY